MLISDPSRLKGTFIDGGGSVSGAGDGSTGGAAPATSADNLNISVGAGQEKFTGGAPDTPEGGSADPAQEKQKPTQTPEQNKAYAELRRRAEAAEGKLQQYTQTVQQHFGQTHGLNDLDSYFSAIGQTIQQQQAQQQQQVEHYRTQREEQLAATGYNIKDIREIMRSDPAFIQMNQENQNLKRQAAAEQQQRQIERIGQQLMADHAKLKEKYGDMVSELKDLDEETVTLLKQGIPLRAAWLQANEDSILEHAKTTTKAKTMKDIGSKNHLDTEKGGGGEFEAQIELSAEEIKAWRGIHGKNLTVAQIKQIVSKYRKAGKK